jgi:deazaflavin-dependent oxidoreductase (nitroreductase family)
MSPQGEYEPSPWSWVREQVETYERTGGREGNTFMDTGLPVVLLTTRGQKTGKLRKSPLMRVEHDGEYALVASKGGMPDNPLWYGNLIASPHEATLQDGPEPFTIDVREVEGDERAAWWSRAVEAYPPYAEYQEKADRIIPVVVVARRRTT